MIKVTCKFCKKNVFIHSCRVKNFKFCSRSCMGKFRIGRFSPQWKGGLIKKFCKKCGKIFYVYSYRVNSANFCSQFCANSLSQKGNKHWNWKGGIKIVHGYRYLYQPDYPYSNKSGYIPEHRFVMERKLGRPLKKQEVVHHKNHIKTDNRLLNLQLCKSRQEHNKLHPELLTNNLTNH